MRICFTSTSSNFILNSLNVFKNDLSPGLLQYLENIAGILGFSKNIIKGGTTYEIKLLGNGTVFNDIIYSIDRYN
tara:strand:+ start:670 stop:894 length:225 start_codon:yes stop_codon:yes gene_type:complete